jgi:hypothetical protein
MNSQTSTYELSDDMALGIYDADGSVLMNTTFRKNSVLRNTLGFQVLYSVGQSSSKVETVRKFAAKFGKKVPRTECRMNQTSPEGQQFRQFLLKNVPKHPDRRRDFLISEQVRPFLNQKLSALQQLTAAYLISKKSVLQNQNDLHRLFLTKKDKVLVDDFVECKEEDYLNKCCLHIQATDVEIEQGLILGKQVMAKIDKEIESFLQKLPTMQMSDDYVFGVHCGDGSFYVALSWKPTEKSHRLRCEPEWAISGDKEIYCKSFANKYGGVTKKVDAQGQIKFVVSGIRKCSSIVSLFEKAPWLPEYKQDQFDRWKASCTLLENKEHFTEEGIVRLLDLSYGLAEKGGRKYSKEQYLEWGLAWLYNPSRQKRSRR